MTHLIRADLLKLARRRGMMASAAALTIGLTVLFYGWRALQGIHPLGGTDALSNLMEGLALLGGVGAIMVGCAAGAGDVGAGVFRDLVATGRPRLQLFASRLPAVVVVVVALAVVTALLAAGGAALFADQADPPSAAVVAKDVAWLAVTFAFLGVAACGVATILRSQAMAIGISLGWHIAASNLLLQATTLGHLRWAVPLGALDRLQPGAKPLLAGMPVAVAVATLVGWALVAGAAGAWRTATMDA
jgi:hypothetical protein